ncbi:SDR family oxidoreductase [Acinetobacter sp. ME22]|uniref:SDR family NAD(P)-dependent oxidoreductase n=1 Tax=Acinetobacter sp. ME22 TaxID=2904802 RepID=UPI001EDC074B|nr:SDR family oxidoreductase [Acinetobacter sp. ME22]MCG2575118.1 SDR family oxidoreductase [Acinetobacter sp. ME22]
MDHQTIASKNNPPVVLITGGGSGIGAATARVLVQQGWTVVICGRRAHILEQTARETGAHALVVDLTEPSSVIELINSIINRFGKLNGLVLNAGIVRAGKVGDLNNLDWATMVETNLTAPYRLLHVSLPHLISSKGSIVGIASVSALRASKGIAGYNATKAGLSMLIRSIAVDYGTQGVRANVICPGWTRSEMADQEMNAFANERNMNMEQAYQLATALVPLQRPALGKEIAALTAWLLSSSASYMNGAEIPIDGGLTSVDPGTIVFDSNISLTA